MPNNNHFHHVIILILLFYYCSPQSIKLPRLDTCSPSLISLSKSIQILSTLGYFKLTLQSSTCQLIISQFNPISLIYQKVQFYQNQQIKSCQTLTLSKNGKLMTDKNNQYTKLNSTEFLYTTLTIDDNGNLRIIGVRQRSSQLLLPISQEIILKSVQIDKLNHKNILVTSQLKLSTFLFNFVNQNNWQFQIQNNQLKIMNQLKTTEFLQTFSLQNISLDRSGIYDENNKTVPFVSFQNAILYPKLNKINQFQIKSPFLFQFNSKWPILRIYDQQKYLIAQFTYKKLNKFEIIKICPPATFLHQNECKTTCPSNYYRKISNEYGECVLNCEYGSIVDEVNKICYDSYKQSIIKKNNIYDTKLIKKCEKQWTPYFYGCNCSSINKFYDRTNNLTCVSNCPSKTLAYSGLCLPCGQHCLQCIKDQYNRRFLTCTKCQQGYEIINNSTQCKFKTQTCNKTNCVTCNAAECNKCSSFYLLTKGECGLNCSTGLIESYTLQKGSSCVTSSNVQQNIKCPIGCKTCSQSNKCLSCLSGYVYFVSPLATTCKFKSTSFSCSGPDYIHDSQRQICYLKNLDNLPTRLQCKAKLLFCQICFYENNSTNQCQLCEKGYFLHNNICVSSCPDNYIPEIHVCVLGIKNCRQHTYISQLLEQTNVNANIIKSSQSYQKFISNGLQPNNDIGGYSIYLKQFLLKEDTKNLTVPTVVNKVTQVCSICRKGFGLSDDKTQCKPCPANCDFCYFARDNSCYKPTIKCTFLDENNNCLESCPEGRFPQVSQNNTLKCLPQSLSSTNTYLKVDSTYYLQADGSKIFYFILEKPVQNINNQTLGIVTVQSVSSSQLLNNRLLVTDSNAVSLQNGQLFAVRNIKDDAVTINLDQIIPNLKTSTGDMLANSVYGAQAQFTHNQWKTQFLAKIGYILSWVILLIHCIYIGNGLMYKMDNLIIFCQSIYFFTFVKLLVGNTLAQYYYGWLWMHLGFYANYFQGTIPSQYQQYDAPISFKLNSLDANFIRNTGFAFSLLLTFLLAYGIIVLTLFLIKQITKNQTFWHPKLLKFSLISVFQLLSMIIFFFSISQLQYGRSYPNNQLNKSFNTANIVFSIIFVCLICVYTIVRGYFNNIAGLYMVKRIIISTILVFSYKNKVILHQSQYFSYSSLFSVIFCRSHVYHVKNIIFYLRLFL